jgi:thioredoxin reductase (NADPH)
LIERVMSFSNITLHTRTELTALEGDTHLERVRFRGAGGMDGSMSVRHLFVFVGAEPNTGWLRTCGVMLDDKGFVSTEFDANETSAQWLPFQTSVQGVFAIGDVRSGSTKRVASAVGEGAGVVGQIHRFLAEAVSH